uniref:Uncharacterized protein n=1 Tax=Trichogramma kaykai TaxID=54128 RepID=A0ABD2XLM6_9HYME
MQFSHLICPSVHSCNFIRKTIFIFSFSYLYSLLYIHTYNNILRFHRKALPRRKISTKRRYISSGNSSSNASAQAQIYASCSSTLHG